MMVSGRGYGWRIRFQWNHENASEASMPSNAAWEETTSRETKLATRAGWSSAMRCPTRAPRSWPTTCQRSCPRASITVTMSFAVVRLQYMAWSPGLGPGLSLSP